MALDTEVGQAVYWLCMAFAAVAGVAIGYWLVAVLPRRLGWW